MSNHEHTFVFGPQEESKQHSVVVLDENEQPVTITEDRLWEFIGDAMRYIPPQEKGEQ